MLPLREQRCPSGASSYVAEARLWTSGYYALALSAQGAGQSDAGNGQVNTDIIHLIAHASVPVQVVLGVLVLFSMISWGVILFKQWQVGAAARQSATFLDVFRKSSKF